MKRMRIMGICLVAAFALTAIGAGTASALPEIGRCVAKAGGKYKDSNCVSKVTTGGTFERVKSAEKTGFTATSGTSFLEGKSGLKVVCSASTAVGKYDADGSPASIKAVEGVVATFTGCGIPAVGVKCNTKGNGEGVIKTQILEGNLGYINKAAKEVGQELHPATKGGMFAEFDCTAGFHIVVKECNAGSAICGSEEKGGNCIISKSTPVNVSAETNLSTFKGAAGVQSPQHFENLKPPICNLENTTNGEKNERSTQNQESTVKSEEALEIFA
jgi:hypothetical protein